MKNVCLVPASPYFFAFNSLEVVGAFFPFCDNILINLIIRAKINQKIYYSFS